MEYLAFFIVAAALSTAYYVVRGASSKQASWDNSQKGNKTKISNGLRLTIFDTGFGWKYCISTGNDDPNPYYSDNYDNENEAMASGLAYMNGTTSPYMTKRQRRDSATLESALGLASNVDLDIYNARQLLSQMRGSGKFPLKELRPLYTRLRRLESAMIETFKNSYSERDSAADDIWADRERVKALRDATKSLIDWAENGKKQALPPPDISSALADGASAGRSTGSD